MTQNEPHPLNTEDQQRADFFAGHEQQLIPAYSKMGFFREQWQVVEELAEHPDVQAVPALKRDDKLWLESLGADVDSTFSFPRATTLVRAGSHLIAVSGELQMSPDKAQAVVYARNAFLGKVLNLRPLGDKLQAHQKNYKEYAEQHPALVPLGHFVAAQRYMHQEGVTLQTFASQYHSFLGINETHAKKAVAASVIPGGPGTVSTVAFIQSISTQTR